MAVGHVTLDGRQYQLQDPRSYRRYLVNQMAPKLGQGQSEYRDLTSWDAWIVDNWQDGIGQKAMSSGALYAEADTRVPNQVVLPGLLKLSDGRDLVNNATDLRYMPGSLTTALQVGSGARQRVSIFLDATAGHTLGAVWLYLRTTVNVTVQLYTATAGGLPNALVDSGTITPVSEDYAFRWYRAAISEALSGTYCLVLSGPAVGQTFDVACGASYTNAVTGVYDGSSWATSTLGYPFYFTDVHDLGSALDVADVVSFNGSTYMAAGTQLYKWSSTNENWTTVGAARSTTITDLEPWNATLYIGLGDSTNYDTMSTGEVYSNAAVPGRLFYGGGGYLWRAVGETVYYSGDGSTWSTGIACGPGQYSVRGMTELDGEMYVATDTGLITITPGDFAKAVSWFGGADTANGVDLLTHMGNMYTTSVGQVLQISSGAVRNIWLQRRDEFPAWVAGQVVSLCVAGTWPVALVRADSNTGFDTVWAWQEVGWHFLAQLPQGITGTVVRYDRAQQRLWIGTDVGMVFSVYVSNYLINPVFDTVYAYQPYGWLETDWFSGGLLEAQKDIESLYLRARNLSSVRTIDAYWQDDDSEAEIFLVDDNGDSIGEGSDVIGEDQVEWSYLGTFTSNREEQRWALGDNRPNTKEFRLGLRLSSTGSTSTPRLEAHRLKYHMMVSDWFGWDLTIAISGSARQKQQMLDGEMNSYTAAEQVAHLGTLSRQVAPFYFTDIDGEQYEVKVKNATFSPDQVEYFDGELQWYGTYTLQIEQVTSAA